MPEMGAMKRRLLNGELFRGDAELEREVARAAALCDRFNATASTDEAALNAILAELLGEVGEGVTVKPPFRCDYGYRTSIGARTFINWDCSLLDGGGIEIGSHCQIAPGVQLTTATHPIDPGRAATAGRAPRRSRSATTSGSAPARSSARTCRSAPTRSSAPARSWSATSPRASSRWAFRRKPVREITDGGPRRGSALERCRPAQSAELGWPTPGHGESTSSRRDVLGRRGPRGARWGRRRRAGRARRRPSRRRRRRSRPGPDDDQQPGALVDLVLLQALAGREVDHDHAALVVGGEHLGVVRLARRGARCPSSPSSAAYPHRRHGDRDRRARRGRKVDRRPRRRGRARLHVPRLGRDVPQRGARRRCVPGVDPADADAASELAAGHRHAARRRRRAARRRGRQRRDPHAGGDRGRLAWSRPTRASARRWSSASGR